jgi:ATP-dependent Lhr-like helicase
VAAGAWEADVLAPRCEDYGPGLLDTLCLMGRAMWGRLSSAPTGSGGPLRSSPIALFTRANAGVWLAARTSAAEGLDGYAAQVHGFLSSRGASFAADIVSGSGLLLTQVEAALAELAGRGLVTADGFAGLRALLLPAGKRAPVGPARRRARGQPQGIEHAGRWSLLAAGATPPNEAALEAQAWVLLRRWGVVVRRVVEREPNIRPWRELVRVWRRLEARGEIRGGRFVTGVSGEQFALPEAVGQLRSLRRAPKHGELIGLSAADPLNLTGVLTPDSRVPALSGNRLVLEDGLPVAAKEGREVRWLVEQSDPARRLEIERALVRRRMGPVLRTLAELAG